MSIRQCQTEVSSKEFAEWIAFFQIEQDPKTAKPKQTVDEQRSILEQLAGKSKKPRIPIGKGGKK